MRKGGKVASLNRGRKRENVFAYANCMFLSVVIIGLQFTIAAMFVFIFSCKLGT